MPGIDKDGPSRSALLAPIAVDVAPGKRATIGGIILRSHEPDAFGARQAHDVEVLIAHLAPAIAASLQERP